MTEKPNDPYRILLKSREKEKRFLMFVKIAALVALFVLTTVVPNSAQAKKLDRDEAMKRIEKACHEDLKDEDSFENYKDVCACSVRNLRKHVADKDLELLTRSHEGDETADETLQKPEYEDLLLMDYDISYSCSTNPDFIYKKD